MVPTTLHQHAVGRAQTGQPSRRNRRGRQNDRIACSKSLPQHRNVALGLVRELEPRDRFPGVFRRARAAVGGGPAQRAGLALGRLRAPGARVQTAPERVWGTQARSGTAWAASGSSSCAVARSDRDREQR
jgi:hypothetical protein